jgi:hypothetical protein
MIVDESNQQSSSMDEGESTQTNSSSKNSDIKSTLTLLKKSEECSSNYFEETESLKYNSSYKAALPDFQNNNYRKSSTLSTNVSQSDFQLDSLSPKKSFKECSSSSLLNFSRERFSSSPISNYYDGTDNYFKGLNPENNNYLKSNNYLEKKLFFREHYPSVDLDIIYKEREKLNYSNEFSNNHSTILNTNTLPSQNAKTDYPPLYCVTYPGIDRKL